MPFDFDGTGIELKEQGSFENKLLPKGWYDWEILDFVSKDGKQYPAEGLTKENKYPKVDMLVACITPGLHHGVRIFHSVAFLPKDNPGAGMALHFLKTIGQSYEGKFIVDPLQWIGHTFRGYVIIDEYNGKKNNKIKQVETVKTTNDDLPF
jgi:hypothetical protein